MLDRAVPLNENGLQDGAIIVISDAVREEAAEPDPVVLVQDYHYALAPRMIRERLPRATIIAFWHIPWPNAEHFGICPWANELLDGMLGASIVGFHTQLHCNNFVDSVDRYLEARIDRERHSIFVQGREVLVRPYPISIEWPNELAGRSPPVEECRRKVRERLGLAPDALLGVGVDRLDYTKGIEERILAVERLLERFPRLRRRFTFAQIAAPSRALIPEYEYADLLRVVLSRAARSVRRAPHYNLEAPAQPVTGPYYCHKHRRICKPTENALKFLRRYTEDTLARIVESVMSDQLALYLEEHPDDARMILDKCFTAARAREAARRARDLILKKNSLDGGSLPGKLADCSDKDPDNCEIYLVEGDSAGGSPRRRRSRAGSPPPPPRGRPAAPAAAQRVPRPRTGPVPSARHSSAPARSSPSALPRARWSGRTTWER